MTTDPRAPLARLRALELDAQRPAPVEAPGAPLFRLALQLRDQGFGRQAPFARYAMNPVGFFREVLGIEPWGRHEGLPADEASQIDILEAVRDHDRVAVRSGHKTGKSSSAAGLALWWPLTRPHGRVTLTAPSGHQVRGILWGEIRQIFTRTHPAQRGKSLPKLPGVLHVDPHNGYELGPGWGIVGTTTDGPERMSGKSGAEQLFIVDEASGYSEEIFVSIFGNLAGGGKVAMFSNPTRPSGTFYDAFNDKRHAWKALHVSSTSTPNFHGRHIDGLAGPTWLRDTAIPLYGGPGSPLYEIRVEGNFPTNADNAIVSMVLLEQAVARWATTEPEATDELDIGVDVARQGDDESVLVARRGRKILVVRPTPIDGRAGALPPGPQIGEAVVEMVRRERKVTDRYRPRVKVDVIGVGTSVVDYLVMNYSEELEIVAVNGSSTPDEWLVLAPATEASPALTAATEYRNKRTQLAFGVRMWLADGGALPPDEKLAGELVATTHFIGPNGKIAAEGKDEVKKRLRRSPDRADAVALAIYDPARVELGGDVPDLDDLDGYRITDRGFG